MFLVFHEGGPDTPSRFTSVIGGLLPIALWVNTFPKNRRLEGRKIVVDCANGAAYRVAPTVLWELGAEVIPLGVKPDGFNINEGCGSTSPEFMCSQVVVHGADLGIALDGDADRLVMCDETGRLLDGDQVMALVAEYWARTDRLRGGGVVATVMSNLAFERHLWVQFSPTSAEAVPRQLSVYPQLSASPCNAASFSGATVKHSS